MRLHVLFCRTSPASHIDLSTSTGLYVLPYHTFPGFCACKEHFPGEKYFFYDFSKYFLGLEMVGNDKTCIASLHIFWICRWSRISFIQFGRDEYKEMFINALQPSTSIAIRAENK